jgi:enoyl-CoA hydratase
VARADLTARKAGGTVPQIRRESNRPQENAAMTDRYARYTRLKFDRPHPKVLRIAMENGRMNTADEALHAELAEIWHDVDRDESVNVAIFTGAGKVFSAGGDFNMIKSATEDFNARARQWKEAREMVYGVINCNKPVVSAMRGVAVGAGLVCGILADVSIATKDCRIIDGHTRLGVAAGDHAAIVWPLLCGLAKAKYYLLTCDQILGEEAERIGLITFAVDDDQLEAKSIEVATKLAEGAQSAIRWTKSALNNWLRAMGPTFDASLALEFFGFGGPDVKEGLNSHLEKRRPNFPPAPPI